MLNYFYYDKCSKGLFFFNRNNSGLLEGVNSGMGFSLTGSAINSGNSAGIGAHDLHVGLVLSQSFSY